MTLYGCCCCCCWLLLVWAGVVSCCWVGMSSPTEGSHSTPSYRLISILAPPHHHSDQTGPASTTLRGSQGDTNNTCWSSQHQLLLLTWGPRVVCGGLSVQCYEAALLRPRLDTGLSRPAHHNQDIIWLPGHHLTARSPPDLMSPPDLRSPSDLRSTSDLRSPPAHKAPLSHGGICKEKFRGYGNIVGHFPWWCCWRDLRCFYLSKKEETSRVFP